MKTIKSLNNPISSIVLGIILTLVIFVTGCSDSQVTNSTGNNDNLEVSSFSTSNTNNDLAGDILILNSAKILIKDIKLNTSDSEENNFKTGPFVMDLYLNSSVNVIATGMIPAGAYDRIKFEIHKPNNNEIIPDPEFRDGSGNYSVIVRGSFNGNPFIYKSKKSAHQFLGMNEELIITAFGKTNVTLMVEPYTWFIKDGVLLDPDLPANENDIDNNIKDSFKAFKDNDKNGIPD